MRLLLGSKAIFFLLATLSTTNLACAQAREYVAEVNYCVNEQDNMSISKEIAFIKAKRAVVIESLPYIDLLIKDRRIELTKDQLAVLASFFADFEYIEEKKIVAGARDVYTAKLRMVVSPEKITKSAIDATGEGVASDYKKLLEQIDNNENQLSNIKENCKVTEPMNEEVKKKKQELQKTIQALLFYYNGFEYFMNSKYDLAITEFTKSIAINHHFVKAFAYRARSYQLIGDTNAAIKDYNDIINTDPLYEKAYYNLGTIYIERSEEDLGIANLTKAIMLNPGFPYSYTNRGAGYMRRGLYSVAIVDFTKSISLNPNDPQVYNYRAFAEYKKGDLESAIRDANKAIELNADYVDAYFIRGLTYLELLDVDKGMFDVVKACKMNSNDACNLVKEYPTEKIEYKKAWSFYANNQIENALQVLKKINKPDDERTLLLQALIYLKQNKPQDTLNTISRIRTIIEMRYSLVKDKNAKNQELTGGEMETLEQYYYMLFASGSANFIINNYKNAIDDLRIYLDKYDDILIGDMLGICYVSVKEYELSLKYFIRGFKILERQNKNDNQAYFTEAYNIASVYALMDNIDQAIHWAKIPLEYNRKQWLEKIKTDKDFDHILKTHKFKNFLVEQERLLTLP